MVGSPGHQVSRDLGRLAAVVLLLGAVQGCAVLDLLSPSRQRGLASWYGPGFYGEATAGGTVYTGGTMTAAVPRAPWLLLPRAGRSAAATRGGGGGEHPARE